MMTEALAREVFAQIETGFTAETVFSSLDSGEADVTAVPWPKGEPIVGRCLVLIGDDGWLGNACPIPGGVILECRNGVDAFRLDEALFYRPL